jgi:hypothetical protein
MCSAIFGSVIDLETADAGDSDDDDNAGDSYSLKDKETKNPGKDDINKLHRRLRKSNWLKNNSK